MKKLTAAVVISLAAGACAANAEWYENMKLKGDVRYRHERIDEEGKDDRSRDRIRLRLGAFSKVSDEVDVGVQLATGEGADNSENPTSSNVTLGDSFSGKAVFVDMAYLDWHPAALPGLSLIAGKMSNPFIRVGDYIWDSDVTPEGLAVTYKVGDEVKLLANGGYFWIAERSSDDDTMLYGGQLALKAKPAGLEILAGGSYYHYDNVEGMPVIDFANNRKSYGNSTTKAVANGVTNVLYATGFNVVEGFAQAAINVGIPVTLYGSYVVNVDADENDTGYIAGLTLGKLKEPGSFSAGYNYRRLEKDAAFAALVDSDSWGGGTDGSGHKFMLNYQLRKNLSAHATYFLNDKRLEDSVDYERLQFDLVAKF